LGEKALSLKYQISAVLNQNDPGGAAVFRKVWKIDSAEPSPAKFKGCLEVL